MIAALQPEHRDPTTALAILQNRVCEDFDKTHLQRAYNGYLYHYTNDIGLFAILQTGVLWLSDYTTLNDPKEISYGIEIGHRILSSACDEDESSLALLLSKYFGELVNGSNDVAKYYILSMSLADDELGQWRSYGNNGYGYSLEYEAASLSNAFDSEYGSLGQAFRVLYQEDLLISLVTTLCTNALTAVRSLPRVSDKDDLDCIITIANSLFLEISFVALHFKHPAYQAEREFRFLTISPQVGPARVNSRKRVRNHKLIDFIEYPWPRPSLTGILSGPTVKVDNAKRFADMVVRLNMAGSPVRIRHSQIPYRP